MVRFLFLLHRYLGIAVGVVMLIWTLSGIIMMYKPYPELDRWESLGLMTPLQQNLQSGSCCLLPSSPLTTDRQYSRVTVEVLGDTPVLRLFSTDRSRVSFDLAEGRAFDEVNRQAANALAEEFVLTRYAGYDIEQAMQILNDQWTVYSSYNPHRPLYRYRIDDPGATEFYLSSRTGEVVQLTTGQQRFWGYAGAVIHWLYPTVLRQHTAVWAQVVIWLTIIGIFLTATGLYIGIRQYRRRSSGRLSPYRGMALIHHYAGLIFGVFTLSWVASGLLSMNPWGALEGEGATEEFGRLSGGALTWSQIAPTLERLSGAALPPETTLLEIIPLAGASSVVAHQVDGGKVRLSPTTLAPQPLEQGQLEALAERLQPRQSIASISLLEQADRYYYVHHEPREFPVLRVVMDDAQRRHYYLSAVDGQLLQKVDSSLRWYRWLFYGLHRGDFSALTRSRPLWDIFMVVLLIGVTAVCATGTYMGYRRLQWDLGRRRTRGEREGLGLTDSPLG